MICESKRISTDKGILIGYHYTTLEAWQDIKINGLQLNPLSKDKEDCCAEVFYLLGTGCIWVYKEPFTGLKLIGQIIHVSCKHNSTKIVCLQVEYQESATTIYEQEHSEDKLKLGHTLQGISQYNHENVVYDLLVKPTKNVKLVGSWNLLEIL